MAVCIQVLIIVLTGNCIFAGRKITADNQADNFWQNSNPVIYSLPGRNHVALVLAGNVDPLSGGEKPAALPYATTDGYSRVIFILMVFYTSHILFLNRQRENNGKDDDKKCHEIRLPGYFLLCFANQAIGEINKMTNHWRTDNSALPPHIWLADWLRLCEKQAAASRNLTLFDLMVRAGISAFMLAQHIWPDSRHWLILCGNGNNGGDGYVVARQAQAAGIRVTLLALSVDKPLPAEASEARHVWLNASGEIFPPDHPWPDDVDVIIDGLLGNGLSSAPRENVAALIDKANRHRAPVLALDVPSGLIADTGAAPGAVIQAQHTVTFLALKPGLFTGKARDVTGKIHYQALGMEDWLTQQIPAPLTRYDASQLVHWFRPRRPCAHKGEHGRLLVIGGDQGFAGAVRMAGEAALRAGCGLVRVLTRKDNITAVLAMRPELMVDELTPETLDNGLQWADALVIGPGLGQQAWGKQALQQAENFCKPMLWDADALNLLALHPHKQSHRIITPHPAEAARLLNCSVSQIERDRLLASEQLQRRYGGCVLLKGAGSIAQGHKQRGIIDVGNPGMASAGMGDILSGIIGGLLAQGVNLYTALCAGSVAHGAAADWLARQYGTRGLLALDVLNVLHRFINPESDDNSL